MTNIIQHITMPNNSFAAPTDMYVRLLNDKVINVTSEKKLLFQIGGRIKFDTYFNFKDSPLTKYLGSRQEFAIRLGFGESSRLSIIITMLKFFICQIFSYNYASTKAVRLAVRDFVAGPDFFLKNMDMAEIRESLSKFTNSERLRPMRLHEFEADYPLARDGLMRKFFRIVTLNGLLIPNLFSTKTLLYRRKLLAQYLKRCFFIEELYIFMSRSRSGIL